MARFAWFLAWLGLTGCVGPANLDVAGGRADSLTSPIVIAILDTGAYPYIEVFVDTDETAAWTPPPGAIVVPITRDGPVDDRFAADWPVWQGLQPEVLYRFSGTRLLGISFGGYPDLPPMVDNSGHGTSTSYLAARDGPLAVVVLVQVALSLCEGTDCTWDESVARGMEWIADQEWIDVVSLSIGMPGGVPDVDLLDPDAVRFRAAAARASSSGKLLVAGAGNQPVATLWSSIAGPPHVIAVGGADPSRRGESVLATKGVDVVANFSELVPLGDDGQLEPSFGTSLATPIVAGTLATALHLTGTSPDPQRVATFRAALNASAVTWSAGEWDARSTPQGQGLGVLVGASAPVLLQSQLGWGYVDASLAPEIARRVLEEDFAIPEAKSQAALTQGAYQRAREEYWQRARLLTDP